MIPCPVRATSDDYFCYPLIYRLHIILFVWTVKCKEIVDLFFSCPTNSPETPHLQRNAGKSSCVRCRNQPMFDTFAWRMAEMFNRLSNLLPINFPLILSKLQLYFIYNSFIEVTELCFWFSEEYLPGNPWKYLKKNVFTSQTLLPILCLKKKEREKSVHLLHWKKDRFFLELSFQVFPLFPRPMLLATHDHMFCYSTTWTFK